MPRTEACALGVPTVEAQPPGGRAPERCGQGVFVVTAGAVSRWGVARVFGDVHAGHVWGIAAVQ